MGRDRESGRVSLRNHAVTYKDFSSPLSSSWGSRFGDQSIQVAQKLECCPDTHPSLYSSRTTRSPAVPDTSEHLASPHSYPSGVCSGPNQGFAHRGSSGSICGLDAQLINTFTCTFIHTLTLTHGIPKSRALF